MQTKEAIYQCLCLVVAMVVLFNSMKYFVSEAVCMYILYSRMKAESPLCRYHRENTTYLFETSE